MKDPPTHQEEEPVHVHNGNCFAKQYQCTRHGCSAGTRCDACHLHDEERGDCSGCVRCPACDSKKNAALQIWRLSQDDDQT